MKITSIYIISWFGDRANTKVYERRLRYHRRQLKWCKENNLKVHVYAQDYDKEQYVDGVTYFKNTGDSILPPGHARNVLLKHHYSTDDDFAVFADNDCVLYHGEQHKDSIDFVDQMRQQDVTKFKDIGMIVPLNPARNAFTKEIAKPIYDSHYTFKRTAKVGGGWLMIKNFKKHIDQEVYFDEEIFKRDEEGLLLPGEDSDFAFTIWKLGQGAYQTNHAIMCEWGRANSTWVDHDNKRYKRHIEWFVPTMNDKHGQIQMLTTGSTNAVTGFNFYGMSRNTKGEKLLRFGRCVKERTSKLKAAGHTEIEFHALQHPTQIPDMLPLLEKTDLYANDEDFRDGVDRLSGKGGKKSLPGRNLKFKSFINWKALDPYELPVKIQIRKDGEEDPIEPSEQLFTELFTA